MIRPWVVIAAVAASVLAGFAAGYAYRRTTAPTIQERARDVAGELKSSAQKLTK